MDTSAFGQVGRYGTISLMKRNETDMVVTAFGIDTDTVTFGRDLDCSVRLYYPDVSPVHCKVVFEEYKAFLVVLGATGLIVDGCQVYPKPATNCPTTIALSNNSELEIHGKRFRFSYPPKELRPKLYATPARPSKRELRLSMIHSAQVFSPRPSHDPRENLRILKSPVKPFRTAAPQPSPSPSPACASPEDVDEHEEVVLVQGNHPHVLEEDKDLVILEDVEVEHRLAPPPAPFTPSRFPQQTPQRNARPSLHKAVLLKSAHKVFEKAEAEKREEEEEMEVCGAIIDENTHQSDSEEEGDKDQEGGFDDDDDDADDEPMEKKEAQSSWRQSLERMWPFSRAKSEERKETVSDETEAIKEKDDAVKEEDEQAPLPSGPGPYQMPIADIHHNPFMTPQIPKRESAPVGRLSMGLPRRVPAQEPWKVNEIIVIDSVPKAPPTTPAAPSPVRVKRKSISAEERNAIRERRRSAARTPDTFFAAGAPGMSPTKARQRSPEKPLHQVIKEEDEDSASAETRDLLERMKQTVQVMKRRSSSIHPSETTSLTGSGSFVSVDTIEEKNEKPNDDDDMALTTLQQDVQDVTISMSSPQKVSEPPIDTSSTEPEPVNPQAPLPGASRGLFSASRERKRVGRVKVNQETPSLADDEASPAVMERQEDSDNEEETKEKPKARLLRKSTQKDNQSTDDEAPKPRTRTTRAKATPTSEEQDSDSSGPSARTMRGRKAPSVEPEPAVKPKAPTSRRGRSASVEPTAPDATASKPTSKGRGRAGRAPKGSGCSDSESETTATTTRSGRSRKAASTVAQPLATVDEATERPEPPRTTKTRAKSAAKVKEEDNPVELPKAGPRSRAKKVKNVDVISENSQDNSRGKENTARAAAEEDVAPVKTRSRGTAAKVKHEVVSEPEPQMPRTRVTRARTKTHE